jgi:hypothetical protein
MDTGKKISTNREKKNLIGFILAAIEEAEIQGADLAKLTKEFMDLVNEKKPDAEALYEFFQKNGFTEITHTDCNDILASLKRAQQNLRPGLSGPGHERCVAGYKAY